MWTRWKEIVTRFDGELSEIWKTSWGWVSASQTTVWTYSTADHGPGRIQKLKWKIAFISGWEKSNSYNERVVKLGN